MALHTLLVKQEATHSGIVLCPQRGYSLGEQMRRLVRLVSALSSEEMVNRVEFLSAWGE